MSKIDYIPYLNDYLRNNYPYEFIKKNNFDRYNNLRKNIGKLKSICTPSDYGFLKDLLDRKYFFNRVKEIKKKANKKKIKRTNRR